jgi:hypothetical protein
MVARFSGQPSEPIFSKPCSIPPTALQGSKRVANYPLDLRHDYCFQNRFSVPAGTRTPLVRKVLFKVVKTQRVTRLELLKAGRVLLLAVIR